jgi:prepilin-type N-terminal cleavage/methylation domain-containing protein
MARIATARSAAGHRPSPDAGFSLIESVVALTLFVVIAGAATAWLINTINLTTLSRDRLEATALASQQLEKIREERNVGQELDATTHTVTFHNVTFDVVATTNPAINTYCPSGQSRQVSVVVNWTGATAPVRVDSELAC